MADILKGEDFADGQQVTGARLDNLVDNAVIQPAFISAKSAVTPVSSDSIVIFQASSSLLKKCTIANILALGGIGTVTSVALAVPGEFSIAGSPITSAGTITIAWQVQSNREVFCGPQGGPDAVPTFRILEHRDVFQQSHNIPANLIDWNLAQVFYKLLTATVNFTFGNDTQGMSIIVILQQDGTGSRIVNWPTGIKWPGGVAPVMTTNPNRFDRYNFTKVGTTIIGTYTQNLF